MRIFRDFSTMASNSRTKNFILNASHIESTLNCLGWEIDRNCVTRCESRREREEKVWKMERAKTHNNNKKSQTRNWRKCEWKVVHHAVRRWGLAVIVKSVSDLCYNLSTYSTYGKMENSFPVRVVVKAFLRCRRRRWRC